MARSNRELQPFNVLTQELWALIIILLHAPPSLMSPLQPLNSPSKSPKNLYQLALPPLSQCPLRLQRPSRSLPCQLPSRNQILRRNHLKLRMLLAPLARQLQRIP